MSLRTIFLVTTAVALSAYAAYDRWPMSTPTPATPDARAIPAKTLGLEQRHPLEGIRAEELRDTVEKPLFDPTRRARRVPPPPPPAPSMPPMPAKKQLSQPDFRLVGIASGGGQAFALLFKPGQARPVQVEVGSVIDGWRVEQIGTSSITLIGDGRSVVVRLTRQR